MPFNLPSLCPSGKNEGPQMWEQHKGRFLFFCMVVGWCKDGVQLENMQLNITSHFNSGWTDPLLCIHFMNMVERIQNV